MPFTDLPQSQPQVFYSLAATLIPIFLFGGTFVAQLTRPPRGLSHASLITRGILIPIFGGIAITAEAMAINGAVAGETGDFQRGVIVFALISGLTVTVGGIWMPWASRVRRVALPRQVKWIVIGVPGLFLLASAYSIVSQMDDTITLARETDKQVRLTGAIRLRAAEIRESERRIDTYNYRVGKLKERRAVAIERDEPVVEKILRIEISTQEQLKQIEEKYLVNLFRKGQKEIDQAKPDF